MKPLLLDLFSGIGGFSLGLERAGFETIAFCEIDPFCKRVLAHHWPGRPIYADVRELTATRLRADGISHVDAICGGFPCQDISTAGKGAGLDGERSGLWREFARLVGELRPRFVIVENVGALRGRGLASILGDLAEVGFSAEWHSIPAAAVGAPHLRDRIWIIAWRNEGKRPDGSTYRTAGKPSLSTMARTGLIPTPTASDANGAGSRNTETSKAHPGVSLNDWARGDGGTGRLLPTPQAEDHRNCADYSDRSRGHSPQLRHLGTGQLNPRFVEWMQHYPPDWTNVPLEPTEKP